MGPLPHARPWTSGGLAAPGGAPTRPWPAGPERRRRCPYDLAVVVA